MTTELLTAMSDRVNEKVAIEAKGFSFERGARG